MTSKVFISYSSENTADAEAIRKVLEENGLSVWMASHDIGGGEDFSGKIQEAIESCSCFLLLLSAESQSSPWVPKELDAAIGLKKPVVPVQLKQIDLTSSFRFALVNTQIVTLPRIDERDAKTRDLIKTVKKYVYGEEAQEEEAPLPEERKANFMPWLAGAVAVLLLLAFAISGFPKGRDVASPDDTPVDSPKTKVTEEIPVTESDEKEKVTEAPADNADPFEALYQNNILPKPSDTEKNQIPAFFENAVVGLKNADGLTKANRTKRIKVGQSVSLTTVWNDATIYSENTDIALGDGVLVKGIAPGETYVVIAVARNVCSAYYIIVEE